MSSTEVIETIRALFGEVVPGVEYSRIALAGSPRGLGANSIDRAEIITETMRWLGISVPKVNGADTVGDVVAIMSGQVAGA